MRVARRKKLYRTDSGRYKYQYISTLKIKTYINCHNKRLLIRMHQQFLSRRWQQPRAQKFGGINMKPGNNVYLWQEKHLCWQLER